MSDENAISSLYDLYYQLKLRHGLLDVTNSDEELELLGVIEDLKKYEILGKEFSLEEHESLINSARRVILVEPSEVENAINPRLNKPKAYFLRTLSITLGIIVFGYLSKIIGSSLDPLFSSFEDMYAGKLHEYVGAILGAFVIPLFLITTITIPLAISILLFAPIYRFTKEIHTAYLPESSYVEQYKIVARGLWKFISFKWILNFVFYAGMILLLFGVLGFVVK